jgi:hypothetical protein
MGNIMGNYRMNDTREVYKKDVKGKVEDGKKETECQRRRGLGTRLGRRRNDNITMHSERIRKLEVCVTGSKTCQMAEFDISGFKLSLKNREKGAVNYHYI